VSCPGCRDRDLVRAFGVDGLKRLAGACPGVLQLAYRLRARRTLGERCGA